MAAETSTAGPDGQDAKREERTAGRTTAGSGSAAGESAAGAAEDGIPAADEAAPDFGTTAHEDVEYFFGPVRAYLSEVLSPEAADRVAEKYAAHREALEDLRAELANLPAEFGYDSGTVPAPTPGPGEMSHAQAAKGAFERARAYMAQNYATSRSWGKVDNAWSGPGRIQRAFREAAGERYAELSKDRRWKDFFGTVVRDTAGAVSKTVSRLADKYKGDRVAQKILTRVVTTARNLAAEGQNSTSQPSSAAPAAQREDLTRISRLAAQGLPRDSKASGPGTAPPQPGQSAPRPAAAARTSGAEM